MELPKKLILMNMDFGEPSDKIQDIKLEFQEYNNPNKTYYAYLNKAAIMRIKGDIR